MIVLFTIHVGLHLDLHWTSPTLTTNIIPLLDDITTPSPTLQQLDLNLRTSPLNLRTSPL